MKIQIVRVPPSRVLEGVDLGPDRFDKGHVYELDVRVGRVLVVWGYAQPLGEDDRSSFPVRQLG